MIPDTPFFAGNGDLLVKFILIMIINGIAIISANNKGYSIFCWFFPADLIGLIAVFALPNLSELQYDELEAKKKTGNVIGAILSILYILRCIEVFGPSFSKLTSALTR